MSQKVSFGLPLEADSEASEPKAASGINSQLRRAACRQSRRAAAKVAQGFLSVVSLVLNLLEVSVCGREALPTGMSAIQRNAAKPQPNENAGIREKRRFASAQQIVAK
jgi:hypothetical protein